MLVLYDLPFNMEMQKKMASSKKNVSNFAFIAKAETLLLKLGSELRTVNVECDNAQGMLKDVVTKI